MVETIKDLEKLLKLLRKQGVTTFECKDLKLALGEIPVERTAAQEAEEAQEQQYDQSQLDQMVGMPVSPNDEELIEWGLTGKITQPGTPDNS